ncbi:Vacuolar protein-sorting-associated protein 27 [Mortierella sp. GBA30]|nr:Vacuolar protein-sorting-associated protein 27 [Mortierella sp. GBA30]
MSWLWSTSAIDELVDKATSENLPAGTDDLALNLEICDQIRSKQVSSKDAVKALKRRIGHKNPNVQLLALGLTDVCVKNGGQHFLVEIAAREFVDNLTSILKAPNCSLDVRNRILGLIQTWGKLFRGKQGLGYVCDTYMILQHEGYQFPPADNVGAALVETQAPPDWTDSDVCTRCRATFTLTNRKHHCRACGSTYCGQCSSKTMSLPHLGVTQEVRVCDGCWIKKKMSNNSAIVQDTFGLGGPAELVPSVKKSAPSATAVATASSSNAVNEDEDLRKAIELSLKEANSRPGYSAPAAKHQDTAPVKNVTGGQEEEDDADLLAAIEASLKESSINDRSGAGSGQHQSSYAAYTYSSTSEMNAIIPKDNNLTETEKDNIEMFSSLVDKLQLMNGDVSGNREVQALYEQISKLQAKVALNLEEAAKKQNEVLEFNEKIDQAVKMYDHLLQERLNSTYQRRMNATNYAHPGFHEYSEGLRPVDAAFNPSNVYPHLSGSDPRYTPYAPPSHPQQLPPFASAPATQPSYQYQPPYPSASLPYLNSTSPAVPPGPDYAPSFASAPPPSQPVVSQDSSAPHPYVPSQNPYYSAPVASISPPRTQDDPFHSQGYQPMGMYANAPPAISSAGSMAPLSSVYDNQHQQQQYPTPQTSAAPVVPVEEKPLIEL